MVRKRLAVAAGSLVAVSAATITASAFLVDTTAVGVCNAHRNCPRRVKRGASSSLGFSSNQLHAHRPEDSLSSSIVQLWLSEASTRMWSKLRVDDDIDIDVKVASARETIETTQAISETLRNRFKVGDSYVWLYRDVDGNPTSWEKYTVTGIEETKHNRKYEDERERGEDERPEFVATIEMSTKFEEEAAYQTHHRIKANLIDHVLESSESQEGWRIGFEFFLGDNGDVGDVGDGDGDGGAWKSFGKGDNIQAFEEKFDVFSMVSAAAAAASVITANVTKATKGGAGSYTEDPRDECLVPWTTLSAKTHCDTENNPSTRSASVRVVTTKEGTSRSSTEAAEAITTRTTKQQTTARLTQTKRHGYTESWYGPSNHDTLSGIALYKEFPNSKHSFSLIERTTRSASGAEVSTDAIEIIV